MLVRVYCLGCYGGVGFCRRQGSGVLQGSPELLNLPPLWIRHPWSVPGLGRLLPQTSSPYAWLAHFEELQALELLLTG